MAIDVMEVLASANPVTEADADAWARAHAAPESFEAYSTEEPRRRRTGLLIAAAAVVVIALAGVLVVRDRRTEHPPIDEPPATNEQLFEMAKAAGYADALDPLGAYVADCTSDEITALACVRQLDDGSHPRVGLGGFDLEIWRPPLDAKDDPVATVSAFARIVLGEDATVTLKPGSGPSPSPEFYTVTMASTTVDVFVVPDVEHGWAVLQVSGTSALSLGPNTRIGLGTIDPRAETAVAYARVGERTVRRDLSRSDLDRRYVDLPATDYRQVSSVVVVYHDDAGAVVDAVAGAFRDSAALPAVDEMVDPPSGPPTTAVGS